MRGLRGIAVGALSLIALQTLVRPGSAGRVAGLFRVPGQIARRFIDPTVPAIPRRAEDSPALPNPFQLATPLVGTFATQGGAE